MLQSPYTPVCPQLRARSESGQRKEGACLVGGSPRLVHVSQASHETSHATTHRTTNGAPYRATHGSADRTSHGTTNRAPDGAPDRAANGPPNRSSYGTPDGTTHRAAYRTTYRATDGTSNRAADGDTDAPAISYPVRNGLFVLRRSAVRREDLHRRPVQLYDFH
jgi:hypothetical protein